MCPSTPQAPESPHARQYIGVDLGQVDTEGLGEVGGQDLDGVAPVQQLPDEAALASSAQLVACTGSRATT